MSKTVYEILEETNPSYMDVYYSPCFNHYKVKLTEDKKFIFIKKKVRTQDCI